LGLTLKEEHRLNMFETKVLRRMLGFKRGRRKMKGTGET
jgi:hypothetical protein